MLPKKGETKDMVPAKAQIILNHVLFYLFHKWLENSTASYSKTVTLYCCPTGRTARLCIFDKAPQRVKQVVAQKGFISYMYNYFQKIRKSVKPMYEEGNMNVS